MDVSLSCSLNGAKLVLSHPFSYNVQTPSKFNRVSCRATKLAEEKGTKNNFYKLLSLDPKKVGVEDIKRAYRTMALQYHPDVCHPSRKEEANRIFVELHKAYKTLSDPILREEYDYELGFSQFERRYNSPRKGLSRDRWEDQLYELVRRSNDRIAQKEESWSSRLRAQRK